MLIGEPANLDPRSTRTHAAVDHALFVFEILTLPTRMPPKACEPAGMTSAKESADERSLLSGLPKSRKLSRLLSPESERISRFGMHERPDLSSFGRFIALI